MARKRFTHGTTPKDAILAQLKAELGDGWYRMTLSRSDEPVVTKAVNQGIDAHLEAITELRQSRDGHGRLKLEFGHESLCVLLRRLQEEDDKGDGNEAAASLRSTILESLKIEEV